MTVLGAPAVQAFLALAARLVIETTSAINDGKYTGDACGLYPVTHRGQTWEIEVRIGPCDLPRPTPLITKETL